MPIRCRGDRQAEVESDDEGFRQTLGAGQSLSELLERAALLSILPRSRRAIGIDVDRRGEPWPDAEDKLLIESVGHLTDKQIALRLSRSPIAAKKRDIRLGLPIGAVPYKLSCSVDECARDAKSIAVPELA